MLRFLFFCLLSALKESLTKPLLSQFRHWSDHPPYSSASQPNDSSYFTQSNCWFYFYYSPRLNPTKKDFNLSWRAQSSGLGIDGGCEHFPKSCCKCCRSLPFPHPAWVLPFGSRCMRCKFNGVLQILLSTLAFKNGKFYQSRTYVVTFKVFSQGVKKSTDCAKPALTLNESLYHRLRKSFTDAERIIVLSYGFRSGS